MNDYLEVRIDITPWSEVAGDVASALLADAGFESFVPDDRGLTAYVAATTDFTATDIVEILHGSPIAAEYAVSVNRVAGCDWNAEWEKHYFKPIVVADSVVVYSSFHTDVPDCRYHIVIDPKMAFGTGHHATTSLMMQHLLDLPVKGARVVDMGTGTGILAILSLMLGASEVTAVEIDGFAVANARENLALNDASSVKLIHGDASSLETVKSESIDLLLANINRNIVLADMDRYAAVLRRGGRMVLSGFYETDVAMVSERAASLGLRRESVDTLNDWASPVYVKQ